MHTRTQSCTAKALMIAMVLVASIGIVSATVSPHLSRLVDEAPGAGHLEALEASPPEIAFSCNAVSGSPIVPVCPNPGNGSLVIPLQLYQVDPHGFLIIEEDVPDGPLPIGGSLM